MEFKIINQLQKQFQKKDSLIKGIGDDCAVLSKDDQSVYLISTDCLVENIHFSFDYFSWADLGYKSLAVNISDICAMGGKALYAFVSLALPKNQSQKNIQDFYAGFEELAVKEGLALAGGDLSSSEKGVFVNITVVGEAGKDSVKYRSGAKAGDSVFVLGDLGLSAQGLELLHKNPKDNSELSHRHKRPELYSKLAFELGKDKRVHAMIDVSDGFVQDLLHVCKASSCGVSLNELGKEFAGLNNYGEDYALLVVGECGLAKEFSELKEVGVVDEGQSVHFESKIFSPKGFDHF